MTHDYTPFTIEQRAIGIVTSYTCLCLKDMPPLPR
jgi:hypothetical protein